MPNLMKWSYDVIDGIKQSCETPLVVDPKQMSITGWINNNTVQDQWGDPINMPVFFVQHGNTQYGSTTTALDPADVPCCPDTVPVP